MNPVWLLVPILVGIGHPVFLQMSVRMSRVVGEMEAAVVLHVAGAFIGLLWMGVGLRGDGLSFIGQVPWWAYLAAVIGVTSLAAVNWTLPIIGVATFCALAVASQLIVALLFDRYGLMGAEVRHVGLSHWVGVSMLVGGAFLVSR